MEKKRHSENLYKCNVFETGEAIMMFPELSVMNRRIGRNYSPFVMAEIGINHEGSIEKDRRM